MNNIIDVDDDSLNNVDTTIPENLSKKPRVSKRLKSNKKLSLKTYIYIDDDEDESPKNHHAATNRESDSKSNNVTKHSPVKLSKCKRTYPGNPSPENVSKSESMIDSKGTLQKLWEKASLKKKVSVQSESVSKEVSNEKEVQCGFGQLVDCNKMENVKKTRGRRSSTVDAFAKKKRSRKLTFIRHTKKTKTTCERNQRNSKNGKRKHEFERKISY